MNRKTLTLTALAATLVVGTSAAAFAHEEMGGARGPEARFVHMLQQFDENKDGKISKDEAKAGQERLFGEIDTDKDGVLTPGELRAHREAMRASAPADGKGAGAGMGPQDGTGRQMGMMGWKKHHGDRAMNEDGQRQGMGPGGRFGGMRMADADENGQISREEASVAGDKLFTRMDRNGDGVLSADDMPKRGSF
ncbi:EF-hand domain-containing protein [Ciceribacter lividus]|uniref:EF hand domain-containing protein n=1 Tax=Ciceribacter lividus TaxID=1197950 RepID=A0A6I7HQ14_9HYPH|nr:EF hand domain-containing protein [Ciceribacter lividus]